METKKNPLLDLEKRKTNVFKIGIVVGLAVTLVLLEYASFDIDPNLTGKVVMDRSGEEEMIEFEEMPAIEEEMPILPEITPPPIIEEIEIVEEEETNLIELSEDDFEDLDIGEEDGPVTEKITDVTVPETICGIPPPPVDLPVNTLNELMSFLKDNVKYPEIDKKNGIQGKVYTRFVINEDGSITNIKILRGVSKRIDNEMIRVLSIVPKHILAPVGTRAQKGIFTLPVGFKLQ